MPMLLPLLALVILMLPAVMLLADAPPPAPATPPSTIAPVPVTDAKWSGFTQRKFKIADCPAYVVEPAVAAPGKPWIWRTAWPDFHAEVDVALVKAGFHIGYIEVVDMLGCDASLDIMDQFYDQVRAQWGLAEKMAMEPCSRGGLHAYRYAARHPERIACVYADTPVMDFKSWPRKWPDGQAEWPKVLKHYGFKDDAAAMAYQGNPIDQLAPIAKAKVPLRHVISLTDQVVPPEENTLEAQRRLRALGHDMEVVAVKEGTAASHGHHFPLPEVYSSVSFVLRHASVQPAGQAFFALRDGLANCKDTFVHKKAGRVVFLGGSITYNGGWRDELMRDLQARFPETKFDFIAAGIPSVGSNGHAFRLEQDVLKNGPVDLVFVEAAVNDGTNINGQTTLVLRAMEGVVAHLRRANPMTDIVQMHFVSEPHLNDYAAGRVPAVIETHEKVAIHYGCVSLDLAKECAARIKAGQFTWASGFNKDVHPPAYGQRVYSNSMTRMLDAAFATAGQPKAHALPAAPLDTASYVRGHYGKLEDAVLVAGFKLDPKWRPAKGGTRDGFVDVPALVAEGPGAEFSYPFTGTAIGLFLAAGHDTGVIEFSIDGGEFKRRDTWTPWSGGLHLPWPLMLADGLKEGPHMLKVRTTDAAKGRSGLHVVHVLLN